MNCKDMFLVRLGGPPGAVKHPSERRFDPGHASGVETSGPDGGKGLRLEGRGGDVAVIGLVDCYCVGRVRCADLVVRYHW
jgi:hypothetical protein